MRKDGDLILFIIFIRIKVVGNIQNEYHVWNGAVHYYML